MAGTRGWPGGQGLGPLAGGSPGRGCGMPCRCPRCPRATGPPGGSPRFPMPGWGGGGGDRGPAVRTERPLTSSQLLRTARPSPRLTTGGRRGAGRSQGEDSGEAEGSAALKAGLRAPALRGRLAPSNPSSASLAGPLPRPDPRPTGSPAGTPPTASPRPPPRREVGRSRGQGACLGLGAPGGVGSRGVRRPVRPPREGAKWGRGAGGRPRGDVWASAEKRRRRLARSGLLASGTSAPPPPAPSPRRCVHGAPQPWSQEGALPGVRPGRVDLEAAGPKRASSAQAQKPRRRFRGCREARGRRRLCPRASASLPGRIPGSPATSRAGGCSDPSGRGQAGRWGRDPLSGERRAASHGPGGPSRSPEPGSAVPYLPARPPRRLHARAVPPAPPHPECPQSRAAHLRGKGTGRDGGGVPCFPVPAPRRLGARSARGSCRGRGPGSREGSLRSREWDAHRSSCACQPQPWS